MTFKSVETDRCWSVAAARAIVSVPEIRRLHKNKTNDIERAKWTKVIRRQKTNSTTKQREIIAEQTTKNGWNGFRMRNISSHYHNKSKAVMENCPLFIKPMKHMSEMGYGIKMLYDMQNANPGKLKEVDISS